MRLFLAVELPGGVREVLARGLGQLRRDLPPARWVRAEGVHLTLKFLGEQSEAAVGRLGELVPASLAGLAPVTVRLGGAGFFPDDRRPRVAWVGGSAPGLEQWVETLEACANELGVPRERRPFAIHFTLARLDRPWGARAVEDFRVRLGKWALPEFRAREVVLFESRLKPSGAEYAALVRWPVGEA